MNTLDEPVAWERADSAANALRGVRLGHADPQQPFDVKGDNVGIDWGYLHLAARDAAAVAFAGGSVRAMRGNFSASGTLPAANDTRMPRAASDDTPGLAAVASLGTVGGSGPGPAVAEARVLLAYDELDAAEYYGETVQAYWTTQWADIFAAMAAAWDDFGAVTAQANTLEADLAAATEAKGGPGYAAMMQIVYRQTLAATKLVWMPQRKLVWCMLKEVGDRGWRDL